MTSASSRCLKALKCAHEDVTDAELAWLSQILRTLQRRHPQFFPLSPRSA
jgi:hypothetical protein